MKLLTTTIFLIISPVMMNSSLAQDDNDLIAAIKEQTKAIERQTEAIKEQTLTIKVLSAIDDNEKSGVAIGWHYNFYNNIINDIKNDDPWLYR